MAHVWRGWEARGGAAGPRQQQSTSLSSFGAESCCSPGGACGSAARGAGRGRHGKNYLRRYGMVAQPGPVTGKATSEAGLNEDDDKKAGMGMMVMDEIRSTSSSKKGKEKEAPSFLGIDHDADDATDDARKGHHVGSSSTRQPGEGFNGLAQSGRLACGLVVDVVAQCCVLCMQSQDCCGSLLCCVERCCLQDLKDALLSRPSDRHSAGIHRTATAFTTVNIDLSGLDCADCSVTVKRTLERKPGVAAVIASAITNKAQVTFDSVITNEDRILKDIRSLGFGAELAAAASATRLHLRLCATDGSPDVDQIDDSLLLKEVSDLCKSQPGIVNAIFKRKKKLVVIDYIPNQARIRQTVEFLEKTTNLAFQVSRDESAKMQARKKTNSWRWRFWISMFFSVPVFLVSFIFPYLPVVSNWFSYEIIQGLSVDVLVCCLLATPIQFIIAWPLYNSAWRALWYGRKANMDALVILSTLTAYIYSVVATIVAMSGVVFGDQTFFETSAIVLTLIILGRYLEALAQTKACNVLQTIDDQQAKTALLILKSTAGDEEAIQNDVNGCSSREICTELIQIGDIIKVLPGAKIPVDGVVALGSTSVDESLITGESLPVTKSIGSLLMGGSINQNGSIQMQATRSVSDSTLAAIGRLVEDAQASKLHLQRIADSVASYFVPSILLLAAVVFVFWLSLTASNVIDTKDEHFVPFSLQFALTVLVVSCPCAIGLAVPMAVMVATSVGASQGIVVKSGAIMETCRRINTVVFDKTGTLTLGRPVVVDHWWLSGVDDCAALDCDEAMLMSLIRSAETCSEHVLAKAVVSYIDLNYDSIETKDIIDPKNFTAVPGRGILANVLGHVVLIGNLEWMYENGIKVDSSDEARATTHENDGRTILWAAVDGFAVCALALEDSPRPEAVGVIQALHKMGIQVWMLSGDQQRTTEAMARRLGITNAIGSLKPEDKLEKIRWLQRFSNAQPKDLEEAETAGKTTNKGRKSIVAMVGDGVNDAPALSQAHVGIAIGGGTNIALAAGDVVLMSDNLRGISMLIKLARRTRNVIVINLLWAFLYNVLAIPLAAGALYPGIRIVIPPAVAGLSEILSSLPIILFSLILRLVGKKRFKHAEE